MKTKGYDITRNKLYPIATLLEALKKLCPKDNLFQTVKTIYNKKDYYTNKSTYVAILDTVAFVEKLLEKEMLSVGKTKQKEFVNWVACSVVAATVQFHPSCDKLEPYFRNTWSQNFEDMDECCGSAHINH